MKNTNIKDLKINPIEAFANQWALVSARKKDGSFNMCTVSWGSLGELFSKDVATVYIKPIRYTDEFVDEDDYFTITFFEKKYKKQLGLLGTKSGKTFDKMGQSGLNPLKLENGITYKEASITIVCKKIYKGQFKNDEFIDSGAIIEKYYKDEPMHHFYIGEIIEVLENDEI